MIFETHAHYDDEAFDQDREELIHSMSAGGIGYIMNVGADIESSRHTIKLTQQYDMIYGAVGVHPSDTFGLSEEDMIWLEKQCSLDKIKAVGEIGLDYHYEEPPKEIQKKWLIRQLALARKVNLPVIIHSREAAKDTLDIMKSEKAEEIGGVIHCFSYGVEMAREYLNMGFYIGVGGVLTFSNAKKLREVVEFVPIDRILLETDSPYLAPVPYRGKRNCSLYIPYVVEELAKIKGLSKEEVEDITMKNARDMYHI